MRGGKTSFEDTAAPLADRSNSDNEVSLIELWRILCRRWIWLLVGPVVGVSIAVAYIALTAPSYECRATLRLGNVPGLNLIEDPGVLSVELIGKYGQRSADVVRRRTPYLDQQELKVKNNLLSLVAVGYSPEEARDFLRQIIADVLRRHEILYEHAIDPLQRHLATIDQQINHVTKQMKELDDLISRLKESNTVQASLVAIERSHLFTNLIQLERDRVTIQQKIASPYSNPSRIVLDPDQPRKPVAPVRSVAVAGGIVIGMLFGFFGVLAKEFLTREKTAARSGLRRDQYVRNV